MKKTLLLTIILFLGTVTSIHSQVCGGVFTDPAGPNANYANGSDYTVTICPTNPGEVVTVTFTAFNTEATWDALYVFDGSSISLPQIPSTNPAANVPGGLPGGYWGTTLPGPFTSTSPDGCLTFRFRSDGTVNNPGWVANVTCAPPPTCLRPTNLLATSVTATSVTLAWDNPTATNWEVLALPCGSPAPTATTVGQTVTTNPYTLNGLTSNTCYNFYVRAVCSLSDSSLWSNLASATTLVSCPQPTTLTASSITLTGASLGWTSSGSATQWEVIILPAGSPAPTSNSVGVPSTTSPYLVTGLTPATCYVFYVRAICSETDSSYWAGGFNFCTPLAPPVCGGQFIDNGGANANYLNNSDNTYTICPTNPGDIVTVVFDAFNTEATWDALYVFDGNSVNAPQIPSANPSGNVPGGIPGGFWGTTIPGPFSSSSTDGCLTFRFRSDGSVTNPGWIANVICAGPPDRIVLVAFVDQNSNGIKDTGEPTFSNGSFIYQQNNDGINIEGYSPTGQYPLYDSNAANTYTFSYQLLSGYVPYYDSGTTTYNNISIAAGSGTQLLYFPILLTQTYNDVSIDISPLNAPRPGWTYTNKITYKNQGLTATNGTITFVKPTQITTFTVTQAGTVNNANGFTYAFTNLLPNETRTFNVIMTVPTVPVVNINDLLTDSATISAPSGDIDSTNNSATNTQIAVNSFDPNDKMESRGKTIPFNQFAQDDYFFYTIRFQNDGTANAIDVRIEDFLNAQIDESTVLMVSSSHNYTMKRIGNQLVWEFKNIYLAPSSVNLNGSRGYVQFKVKLMPGFQAGDIISNSASIYFDDNLPIITNIFNSKFTIPLSIAEFNANSLVVYPNPARNSVKIDLIDSNEQFTKVVFYDILGKTIKTVNTNATESMTVDVSDLSKGLYLIEIASENNMKVTKKLIIE
jgi:hypothetical protein